jgi:uncharacterized membrane protein YsdA (DUF1294 family)
MTTVTLYLIILVILSFLTFLVWGWDKNAAIKGRWRVPERTLLMMIFLGGAAGGALGMFTFRHKTRKPHFRLALWAAGIMQLLLSILFVTRNG